MQQLQRQVLSELIYERLRTRLSLHDLLRFDEDLRQSIARAMKAVATTPREREALALAFLEQAWARIAEENAPSERSAINASFIEADAA